MEGFGYLEEESSTYEGQFEDGCKEGFGVEHFDTCDRYLGEYVGDKFDGQGKYLWADGASYIGQFKEGYRDGYGQWHSGGQTQTFVGFYTRDKKQGSGRYSWSNGCTYDGNFDNDLK
jgi:hypothetical protein